MVTTVTTQPGPADRTRVRAADVTGERVSVDQAAVRTLSAGSASVSQSAVVVAQAQRMTVEESAAVALVSRDLSASHVNTIFLLSPRVTGSVRTVFDLRGAFAFGVGIVLARTVLRMVRLR